MDAPTSLVESGKYYAHEPDSRWTPPHYFVVKAVPSTSLRVDEFSRPLLKIIEKPPKCTLKDIDPTVWFECEGPARKLSTSEYCTLYKRSHPEEKFPQGSCVCPIT